MMDKLTWHSHPGGSQTCRISPLVLLEVYYENREYRFSINGTLKSKHGYSGIALAKEAVIKSAMRLLKQSIEVLNDFTVEGSE